MSKKISITLDENILSFIDSQTTNRSQFINETLKQRLKEQQLKALEQAYIQQAQDEDELTEIELWDVTVGDNLNHEPD